MARKVIWSDAAWKDLEQLAQIISMDSEIYAAAFVREVRDAARSLNRLSQRGRIVPEYGDPSVRELFIRSYRLIYRISNDQVEVSPLFTDIKHCKEASISRC